MRLRCRQGPHLSLPVSCALMLAERTSPAVIPLSTGRRSQPWAEAGCPFFPPSRFPHDTISPGRPPRLQRGAPVRRGGRSAGVRVPNRTDIRDVLISARDPSLSGRFASSSTPAPTPARLCANWGTVGAVKCDPAAITTDPVMANETLIEPLNLALREITAAAKSDALLRSPGGSRAWAGPRGPSGRRARRVRDEDRGGTESDRVG